MDLTQIQEDLERGQTAVQGQGRLYGANIRSVQIVGSEKDPRTGTLPWVDNVFRFCPPPPDGVVPYLEVGIHWNVGGVNGNLAFCPRFPEKFPQGECFICQTIEQLKKNPANKKYVSSLYPQRRFIWNAIPLSDEAAAAEGIAQVFLPITVNNALLGLLLDSNITKVVDGHLKTFVDPTYGRNINIKRKGTGQQNTEYSVVNYDVEPVPQEFHDLVLNPPSWGEMIYFFSQQDMHRMLNGESVKQESAQEIIPYKGITQSPQPATPQPQAPQPQAPQPTAPQPQQPLTQQPQAPQPQTQQPQQQFGNPPVPLPQQ